MYPWTSIHRMLYGDYKIGGANSNSPYLDYMDPTSEGTSKTDKLNQAG